MPHETDPMMFCCWCGSDVHPMRWRLGYRTCKVCGEEEARSARDGWTVAPMHKSNYMLVTELADLIGFNNKGGLVK